MTFTKASRLADHHDVVLVGYRGVDGSVRLDCPEVSSALKRSTDFLGAEVVPRLHAGVPRLRRAAPGGRRRSRRLHAAAAGRRPRGRPPGARLQADRPGQRERRHAPRDDLRLALPAQHPPLGDDRRQPARALPLEPADDRRADRPLLAPLRAGRELQQADRRPRRLDAQDGRAPARPLLGAADLEERRADRVLLLADGVDLRVGAAVGPDGDRHLALGRATATRAGSGSCRCWRGWRSPSRSSGASWLRSAGRTRPPPTATSPRGRTARTRSWATPGPSSSTAAAA